MTDTTLKLEFDNNYEEIKSYAAKINHKFHKFKDLDVMLSECYIYLHDNKEKIEQTSNMIAMSKGFIKRQFFWKKGVYSNKLRAICSDKELQVFSNYIEENSVSIDYDKLMEYYDQFYNTLSLYDKSLFDIYHKKNRQITRELAEHLDISMTSAYDILLQCREINERLKTFLQQNMSEFW